MSMLRERMREPRTYLFILLIGFALIVVDSFRQPADQLTARVYVSFVKNVYQTVGHTVVKGRIQCRYTPTCSNYSIEAVETHGIRRGLALTLKRLMSCTNSVPLGTHDPVPSSMGHAKQNGSTQQE
jgi:putative membrane protein insertion efficiency factor